jgi:hypothetical protein
MYATRNVLQRFYASSIAIAWVKIVYVVRHSCNGSTTSRNVDVPGEVCEGQKHRARAVCMDRGFIILLRLCFLLFFPSTRGPEVSPAKY